METNLTPAQRLTCLLALLDDIIAKDEERTQGEWQLSRWRHDQRVIFVETEDETVICHNRYEIDTGLKDKNWESNASHIAIGSISQGRNARALKIALKYIKEEVEQGNPSGQDELNSILSLYPDEILKRYLRD